jgi:rod shape-determining protein MreD
VQEGILWGFCGGLLLDLLSPATRLGTNSLCLILVALIASLGLAIPLRANAVMPPIMAAIGTLCYFVFLLAIRTLTGVTMDWAMGLVRVALPAAVINAVLIPFIYTLLGWFSDRFRPKLPEEWQMRV